MSKGGSATATITNSYTRQVGALQIQKNVTVNGETITNTKLVDDDYTFNLKSKSGVEPVTDTTVTITITKGIATKVIVADNKLEGSVANGIVNIDKLPTGKYTIEECLTDEQMQKGIVLKLAEGENDIKEVTVSAGESATVETATFTNDLTVTGSLKLKKIVTVNGVETTTALADGQYIFNLREHGKTTNLRVITIKIQNGKMVSSGSAGGSLEDGWYVVKNLPLGSYDIIELTNNLPAGVHLASALPTVTDQIENGTTVTITLENDEVVVPTATFTNNKIYVKVQKLDVKTKGELSGAKFEVYEGNGTTGTLVDSWTSVAGTPHVVEKLEPNKTYTLHEAEAPYGYSVTDDTVFTIASDGKVTVGDTREANSSGEVLLLVENETLPTSACIYKVWDDDGNRDGIRPLSLEVTLYGDGEKVDTVTLSAANDWYGTVADLPMMKDGKEIEYTWKEGSVSGYTLSNTVKSGNLTILTNKHGPVPTKVEVTKRWNDGGAKERPAEIQVQLFADGIAVDKPVTLNAGNNWHAVWEDIPKCTNPDGRTGTQKDIRYTVEEVNVPAGYECRISGSQEAGYVITNTRDSGKLVIDKKFDILPKEEIPPEEIVWIYLPVTKTWEDHDNRDGNRPQSITVHLWKGGEEAGTAVLSEGTGWSYTFGPLPKFAGENEIVYTITEDPVKYYTTKIEGFHITNTYQEELTSVSVRKVWDDNNNEAGKRPTSIHMTLSNGTVVILNEANNWQATVKDLPVRVAGKEMVYTWREQEVIGYQQTSVVQTGNMTVFTNSLYERPPMPEDAGNPPLPGDTWYLFEEYETPLGVEVIINHVGDCFD